VCYEHLGKCHVQAIQVGAGIYVLCPGLAWHGTGIFACTWLQLMRADNGRGSIKLVLALALQSGLSEGF
jgi:hypothetical protein